METLKLKKLASVSSEDSFESSTSKHFIVEDGGELKRLSADSVGSEPFVVTFSGKSGEAVCDKTFEEIKAAYDAGQKIEAVWLAPAADNYSLHGSLSQISDLNNDSIMFTFFCGYFHPDYGVYAVCSIGADSVNVDQTEV